jgi:hypothetical protein
MAYFIIWSFLVFVVATLAKFIYDVQQNKKKEKEADELCKIEAEFEAKEQFQKLAGIKPIETTTSELPTNVTTKKLNEQIVEALLKAAENSEFPKPDESINVRTTKITTIDTNFGSDNDPLASVPMSRVSKEAKQKMAEIAKKDIQRQLDEQVIPDSVRESAQKELDEMNEIVMGTIGSKPKTQTDYRREHSKEFESAVRDVIITTLKEKHKKK